MRGLVSNMERVIDLFRDLDENGDGMVSKKEFRHALPMLGLTEGPFSTVTDETVDEMFDAIDTDGSGSIAYSELKKKLHLSKAIKKHKALSDASAEDLLPLVSITDDSVYEVATSPLLLEKKAAAEAKKEEERQKREAARQEEAEAAKEKEAEKAAEKAIDPDTVSALTKNMRRRISTLPGEREGVAR